MQPNQAPQQPVQAKGQAQMPQQPFTASHNHIYETLRNSLMALHQQGVPGMDEVLHALNKAHVVQMKNAQGQPQMPMQAGQAVMGALTGQMPPQMGGAGVYNQGGTMSVGGHTPSFNGVSLGGALGMQQGMPFGSANVNGNQVAQFGPQGGQ